ncbi:type II secretion system major pseudopilin GspG [Solidesulfovibrio alcoholivorans]|uniref:type II secretion system major pseudopilin GspG n=1 Tax=Solidesulfovibrio alcoholivorans TaxID=81406 RepID=UPI00049613D9|nr:type II secretion system major pseudopilin GspG [Solidesulfovibrio alcoholivorans]
MNAHARPFPRRRAARCGDAAGFTLIELMVVIVILGVLAGLVLPRIVDQPDKARVVKAKMQIESLSMGLKQYKLDNGFYPSTEQGLRALKEKPSIGRVPQNYPAKGYLDTVPKDPWGRDYVYICPGEHGDFDLLSLGADREEGGEGVNADIKSWDLGG